MKRSNDTKTYFVFGWFSAYIIHLAIKPGYLRPGNLLQRPHLCQCNSERWYFKKGCIIGTATERGLGARAYPGHEAMKYSLVSHSIRWQHQIALQSQDSMSQNCSRERERVGRHHRQRERERDSGRGREWAGTTERERDSGVG